MSMTRLLILVALLVPGQAANTGRAEQIALGDAAYERFDNESALAHYLEVLEAQPNDPEALWKAARAYADVGAGLEESDRDQAKELYGKGVAAAREAVDVDPGSAEAHFTLAVCLGRAALLEGGRTKIRLSREIKQEAERALELNPRHDGAYHILGRWHYTIDTLSWILRASAKLIYGGVPPGASVEAGAEMFEKAIELDPTKPVHHLEYARALVELGRYTEARQHLETSIELPRVQWNDPVRKAEAARMLADIRGK